jgi:squalene synthase HpnC
MGLRNGVDHYENFPVASVLVPARLRPAIASIYWFARSADDIADEGKALPSARLASLGVYRQQIALIANNETPVHKNFAVLAQHIREHQLPLQLFADLLTAFEMDCSKKRYANWNELQFYCQHSADPVGRFMLHLFDKFSPERAVLSDQVCTGLQLANFLQDIRHDWAIGRLYIPQDELAAYGCSEDEIAQASKSRRASAKLEAVLQLQHRRADQLLEQGKQLLPELPGRMGMEITATVAGGQRILHHLAQQQYAGFAGRPTLKPTDWLAIVGAVIASRF